MATQIVPAPLCADHQGVTLADRAAHIAAQGPVRTTPPPRPARRVLAKFEAGAPRGSWPAEEYAARQRRDGQPAQVVMDLKTDSFLVIDPAASDDHSKVKDPLPPRPRGPHPYLVEAVA